MLGPLISMCDAHFGGISTVKHCISLKSLNKRPIKSVSYRAGPKAYDFEKSEIEDLLSMNVTKPAQQKKAFPVIFVLKKDWTLRFCVGYRNLSIITIFAFYPLPRTDECMDSLRDTQKFSALDENSGY